MRILLNDYKDVKKFVSITHNITNNISLISDRYVVDAKSILGIFSLDLSKPVDLIIDGNNYQEIEKMFAEFKA